MRLRQSLLSPDGEGKAMSEKLTRDRCNSYLGTLGLRDQLFRVANPIEKQVPVPCGADCNGYSSVSLIKVILAGCCRITNKAGGLFTSILFQPPQFHIGWLGNAFWLPLPGRC